MPTAILAEDEDLPRADLRALLAQLWPELDIVAECEDGPAAARALAELAPDIAFLDIRMPGLDGLQLAKLAAGRCHVVFTTAYDQHALAAFDAGAVDYLLKPVQRERLAAALDRLRQRLAARLPAADLTPLLAALGQQSAPQRLRWISASVGNAIKLFSIDEVIYFESDDKYTRVVTAGDEAHVRTPLKQLMDGLEPEVFWQVNRGLVVRATAIRRALRDELGRITLELAGRPERLPVSRAYQGRFKPM
ncbi:MAG: LytR/AlgR family response regulator transcription factor [Betaproteobacteria bacterium]|jgi:DNA-binding LytR/AlgR family response regulator